MEDKVRTWVNELFAQPDFDDCFLLDVVVKPPKKIEVFLDADKGVTLKKCQMISRKLEQKLDNDSTIPPDYRLEVSSGGVDRPITLQRQYPQHVGRTLIISLVDGRQIEGDLIEVNEAGLLINELIRERGKKNTYQEREIEFQEIVKSIVKLKFK